MTADWRRLRDDMEWVLNPVNGARSRAEVLYALGRYQEKFVNEVRTAFHASVDHEIQKANFDSCMKQDGGEVYVLGIKILADHQDWRDN